MAKSNNGGNGFCEACQWKEQLLLKMSLAVDGLSHQLDETTAKYDRPNFAFKQLLEGRRLQQRHVIRAFDEILDEEERDVTGGGVLH